MKCAMMAHLAKPALNALPSQVGGLAAPTPVPPRVVTQLSLAPRYVTLAVTPAVTHALGL